MSIAAHESAEFSDHPANVGPATLDQLHTDTTWVTVAPITSTIRGLSSEVRVGRNNGLDHDCVVSCDSIVTVLASNLGRLVGYFLPWQEPDLTKAIRAAFDLT